MFHATTILAYKGKNKSVIGGDGQVSFGNTVLKGNAVKIRKLPLVLVPQYKVIQDPDASRL